jgi:hypothetical protein
MDLEIACESKSSSIILKIVRVIMNPSRWLRKGGTTTKQKPNLSAPLGEQEFCRITCTTTADLAIIVLGRFPSFAVGVMLQLRHSI